MMHTYDVAVACWIVTTNIHQHMQVRECLLLEYPPTSQSLPQCVEHCPWEQHLGLI